MLGAFELALPSALTNRLAAVGGVGPKGAFGLGLVCGLIAAPCTGPVLTGILTWIAKTQSAVAGGSAMFAFSLGLGLPFLVVGTFAVQLPKSGAWMIHIKSLLAIILSVVALYFFGNAVPAIHEWIEPGTNTLLIAGALVLSGLAAGAIHRDFGSTDWKDKILKGFGVAATTLSAYVIVIAVFAPERELEWHQVSFEEAALSAQESKMPMVIDFTATWCGACKELDRETFADAEVSREAGRFFAVKVDATDDEDPLVASTMKKLNVVGLPTVLLFSADGKEVRRFTDFVDAETFLAALKQVE
jgi:thiol:disulfide interchange protein DsbD